MAESKSLRVELQHSDPSRTERWDSALVKVHKWDDEPGRRPYYELEMEDSNRRTSHYTSLAELERLHAELGEWIKHEKQNG